MKKLNEMNAKEKREFLSMDLIERLIRLEQRVSASFGEFVHYYDTEYFKHLPEQKKKEFIAYLKKNKRRKYILGFFFSFFILGAIFFRSTLTARVIGENFNISDYLFVKIFLVIIFIFLILFLISFLFNYRRKNRIKKHFYVIDRIYLRKMRK